MPRRPKRPCSYPGCPNLSDGPYCEEHRKIVRRNYERYERDPATRKRYGRTWEKIRKLYADTHPFCEECFKRGIITPVEHVHHKLPLKEGGTNDFENLESLCKSCHRAIHNLRHDG